MQTALSGEERARVAVVVRGIVQGVGFRPFVARLARALRLSGFVRNEGSSVAIEVEGPPGTVETFVARLSQESPPLARVDSVERAPLPGRGDAAFLIQESPPILAARAAIPPDAGPCAACLAEVAASSGRRASYAFTGCQDCGPRYTIARALPFDRARTALAPFDLCADCRREYDDARDRRFHAQVQACSRCGPEARFSDGARGSLAVERARELVRGGGVLALQGVGGFQLACAANDERAVARVRLAKDRPEKPLGLLVRDLEAAARVVELIPGAALALEGPERPLVLLPRLVGAPVAANVAPGLPELGVMLPASALHRLLIGDEPGAWVLTSGNRRDEPLVMVPDEARRVLAAAADGFLEHDRAIVARADDSVVQLHRGRTRVLRRARGYVPRATRLAPDGPDLIAFGGDLKGTICVVRRGEAVVSPHLGDLSSIEVEAALHAARAHLERLLGAAPTAAACDRHPDYVSSRIARESGLPLVLVQHHHAHVAAVLAEHERSGPTLAVVLDGTGYGDDGSIWGGELLRADRRESVRLGRLRPVPVPGGDAAAREPWRSAVAHIEDAGLDLVLPGIDAGKQSLVREIVRKRVASPLASSAGRLFDAVAAIAGVRRARGYEGQAAIELESAALGVEAEPYPLPLGAAGELVELDTRVLVRAVAADVGAGVPAPVVSARFHAGLAAGLAFAVERARERTGLSLVALAGGCFANRRLLGLLDDALTERGFEVLAPALYPPGDGALSLGQAAVASARSALWARDAGRA
jgi:hydrogenase maturation protein HypF